MGATPHFPGQTPGNQLRLFTPPPDEPASPADTFSADLRLSEFYSLYVLPICLQQAKQRTLDQYRQSLDLWVDFTGDPPLRGIDDYTCALFLKQVRELPGRGQQQLADNTVRKHCVHLQFILDRAGPRSRHFRDAKAILTEVPVLQKPSLVLREVTDNFSLDEISQWLAACDAAEAPERLTPLGCTPPQFWRSLLRFVYNIGFRVQTFTAVRWDWIVSEPIGKTKTWLDVPPAALKKKRGRKFYLNESALAAIEPLRVLDSVDGRILPWPHGDPYLQETRRAILAHTKLPRSRHLGFHGLRRALATELTRICGGNDCAAEMALGHSTRNVTRNHYLNRVVMAEAMDRLPQPE
ncbi:MAG TPA: tyrosine-type recombinase/integrase [Pirellulales bacterium]|nr:tyrosine-type recombinase/integrase [Pirellulales bacterium]